jgi:hypothetical protein
MYANFSLYKDTFVIPVVDRTWGYSYTHSRLYFEDPDFIFFSSSKTLKHEDTIPFYKARNRKYKIYYQECNIALRLIFRDGCCPVLSKWYSRTQLLPNKNAMYLHCKEQRCNVILGNSTCFFWELFKPHQCRVQLLTAALTKIQVF